MNSLDICFVVGAIAGLLTGLIGWAVVRIGGQGDRIN